jgi:hypothetical protein
LADGETNVRPLLDTDRFLGALENPFNVFQAEEVKKASGWRVNKSPLEAAIY